MFERHVPKLNSKKSKKQKYNKYLTGTVLENIQQEGS